MGACRCLGPCRYCSAHIQSFCRLATTSCCAERLGAALTRTGPGGSRRGGLVSQRSRAGRVGDCSGLGPWCGSVSAWCHPPACCLACSPSPSSLCPSCLGLALSSGGQLCRMCSGCSLGIVVLRRSSGVSLSLPSFESSALTCRCCFDHHWFSFLIREGYRGKRKMPVYSF